MSFAVTMPIQQNQQMPLTSLSVRIGLCFESGVSALGGNAYKLKFTLAAILQIPRNHTLTFSNFIVQFF